MLFTWPLALVSLLLVPLLAALYVWVIRRRTRYPLAYSSIDLVRTAVGSGPGMRRHVPPALYLVAIGAMAIGLGRPYASFPDPQATGTVILVLDASRSMLETDIAPSRIEAAKAAISKFAAKQPEGIRIGLVAFSGSAMLITPPTTDRKQVNAGVDYLTLGRGTNIGDGLQVALDTIVSPDGSFAPTYANETPRRPVTLPSDPKETIIVLLSDGASTTGRPPIEVARELAELGVRAYTVGLGSTTNTPSTPGLPDISFGGARRFEESTLKEIAEETGGKYYAASSADQLHEVYDEIATHHELVEKRTELTFLAVGAALLLSITGGILGAVWLARLP